MTKAEIYEKAWVLAQKNDFSIVDEIYHPDYKSFDFRTGIYADLEDDKVIVSTLNFNSLDSFLASLPTKIISESGKGNFIFSFVFFLYVYSLDFQDPNLPMVCVLL